MCLDCFDQGCPPDIKDMGQNSGQWRGGLISMSRCDDCPCPHCSHCPHCPLSSWAHLVMTDSPGRALLASKLVNVSNPYISEACLVSGWGTSVLGDVLSWGQPLVAFYWRRLALKSATEWARGPKSCREWCSAEQFGRFCLLWGRAADCTENCTFAHGATVWWCKNEQTLYLSAFNFKWYKRWYDELRCLYLLLEKELSEDSTTLL